LLLRVDVVEAGLLVGLPATFTATVDGLLDTSVTWTSSGGTLTPTGNHARFAADTPGTYILTATSVADARAVASITIHVHGADFTHPGSGVCGQDVLTLIGKLGSSDTGVYLDGNGLVDENDLTLMLTALGW